MCKNARQYGVGMPGGADTLVHFRIVLEKIFRSGNISECMALLDVDFKNAFPSIEWDSIREAIDALLPQLSDWTNWCHKSANSIRLPSGSTSWCDRGAEQGDPLGPVYCAAVIVTIMKRASEKLDNLGITFSDAWYMDDGQIMCHPDDADEILRAVDAEAENVGMKRSLRTDAKSVCRLIGSL